MNTRQEREHQIYTNFTGNSINNTAKFMSPFHKIPYPKISPVFLFSQTYPNRTPKRPENKKESPTNINMIPNLNFKIKFKTPTKNQKKPPIFSNNKRTFFSYYAIQRPLINSI